MKRGKTDSFAGIASSVFGLILALSSCDSQAFTGGSNRRISSDALGAVMASAITALNQRGVTITADMRVEVSIESPCRQNSGVRTCYVIEVLRARPLPRTSHNIALLVFDEGKQEPSKLQMF